MASNKEIRGELGMTQQELAGYLNVSLSQLAMYETGHRDLPSAAMLKLGALAVSLYSRVPERSATAAEMKKQMEAIKKKLSAEEQKHSLLAVTHRRKLEEMRSRHIQCLKALQVASQMLASLPAGKDAKKDKLFLELMHAKAVSKMNDCDAAAQALLQLKADVHSYHAKQAKALMP